MSAPDEIRQFRKARPFTRVESAILTETTSLRTVGTYAWMRSRHRYAFAIKRMAAHLDEGQRAIAGSITELIRLGRVARTRSRTSDTTMTTETLVFDHPITPDQAEALRRRPGTIGVEVTPRHSHQLPGVPAAPAGIDDDILLQVEEPFVMVDRALFERTTSLLAYGLWIHLATRAPGSSCDLRRIGQRVDEGLTTLRRGRDELIEAGFLVQVTYHDGQIRTTTIVCHQPVTADDIELFRSEYGPAATIRTTRALTAATTPTPVDNPPVELSTGSESAADTTTPAPQTPAFPLVDPGSTFPAARSPEALEAGFVGAGNVGAGNVDPYIRFPTKETPLPPQANLTPPATPVPEEEDHRCAAEHLHGPAATTASSAPAEPDPVAQVLQAVGRAWPAIGRQSLQGLAPLVAAALQQLGNTDQLIEHLTGNQCGVHNPAAVLRARLTDLPAPRAVPAAAPDWCGHCDSPEYRWLVDDETRTPISPCPVCAPGHFATWTARRSAA